MTVPKGLNSPIDIAQLVLPVLIFIGICFAVFRAIVDLAQMPPG
ncbi:MAG TPA: hypothetical protein VFW13_09150 [Phenylobacterium sp.]|nr:hypothetical protein [Phenylobacterium sp.]